MLLLQPLCIEAFDRLLKVEGQVTVKPSLMMQSIVNL